jgi:hypothetical protein
MREHNFVSSAHCQGKIRSADLYLAFGLRLLKPAANIHDRHVHFFEDVEMLRNFCTRSKYFLNKTARISLKASKKRNGGEVFMSVQDKCMVGTVGEHYKRK